MTHSAFKRTYRPTGQRKVRAVLSSADTPVVRAEKIARLVGLTTGEPEIITREIVEIAAVLSVYAELDREARR